MPIRVARWIVGLGLVGWIGAAGPARAQAPIGDVPPLLTDRPDFTESAAVVPDGDWQVELGLEWSSQSDGQGLVLPLALLRYGLGAGFELRLGLPSVQFGWPKQAVATTDLSPIELGTKFVHVLSESASIGILPFVRLPLESEQYSSLGAGVGVKLLWAVGLTDWLGLGGNFGLIFAGLGAARPDRLYQASVSLGFGLSDSLGLFLEAFTEIAEGQPESAPANLDGGLTWLVLDLLQLDLSVGMDLRAAPEAVFGGLGLSYRW
jgi:hypothetical protein